MDDLCLHQVLGDEAGLALNEVGGDPLSGDAAMGGADEVSAKPWLSSIVEPSEPPPPNNSLPASTTRLERVFGVQSSSARQGVAYNAIGELIWPSACMCVVYSKQTHEQKFYAGH